jgi:hypothetical protein
LLLARSAPGHHPTHDDANGFGFSDSVQMIRPKEYLVNIFVVPSRDTVLFFESSNNSV